MNPMNPMNPMNWFRKATEKMEDQEASRGVPDITPGEAPEPLENEASQEAQPTQKTTESDGKIDTRDSLVHELTEAHAQVDRLTAILDQPDEVIHLFIGTERYT